MFKALDETQPRLMPSTLKTKRQSLNLIILTHYYSLQLFFFRIGGSATIFQNGNPNKRDNGTMMTSQSLFPLNPTSKGEYPTTYTCTTYRLVPTNQ